MEKEKNYLKNNINKFCTGCRACELSCPKNCISMKEDSEGFIYPEIDKTKCVDCGKCLKVCPVVNDINVKDRLDNKEVYGYRLENKEELLLSSSGGAFTSIVESFCDNNYAIFGVKFDENLKAVHDYITDKKDIQIFRKSKYVQSDVNDSYKKTKEFLNKEYKVLFTGTPCQIAGLKKYLNKEYENLLAVEIICHGVPSKKVLNKYLEFEEKRYNSKVQHINFREKVKKDNKYNSRNLKLVFENGKEIIEDNHKNIYLKGFHKGLFYRPSCYSCKFADTKRYADITIADSWGIENIHKDIDVHKGHSLVILNTAKGKQYFNTKQKEIIKLNEQFVIDNNAQYSRPTKVHKNRDKFFNNIDKTPIDKLVNKCVKVPFVRRVVAKGLRVLKIKR